MALNARETADRRLAIVAPSVADGERWRQLVGAAGYAATCCSGDVLDVVALAPELVIVDGDTPRVGSLIQAVRALDARIAVLLVRGVDGEERESHADATVARDITAERLAEVVARLLAPARPSPTSAGFGGLLGVSAAMEHVYRLAARVAPTRATVLITGESGTGKGALARALHEQSPRASGPFVAVHCAALAESLLEAELFGHERGSFTGADRRRPGRFELAHGGTLFLDEVGEIPLPTQVKLLRVLQERTFERVGGTETLSVDARIVAATNRDLAAEVRAGRFREDLFYRLNVVQLEMPPLRVRQGDLLTLAAHYLERFSRENEKVVTGFTSRARERILEYAWPGNVRELENAIERAVVVCDGALVDVGDLPMSEGRSSFVARIPGSSLAEIERYAILATVEANGGSTMRAAEVLGVSVRTVQYRLNEYGIHKKRLA